MTATIETTTKPTTETVEAATDTTAAEHTGTQAVQAQQATSSAAELDRTTFLVAMVAVMLGIATMGVIGAVTGVPAVMFAAALLGVVAAGSCVYTGVSALSR